MADYREAPATCPVCRVPMEQRMLSGATVDTCAHCRGLWVDWFDGELVAIVKETAPLSFREAVELPRAGACPRCARTLAEESFAGQVVLLRCTDCGGCFVPRASFNVLLDMNPRDDADETQRGALARLLDAIRHSFRW